METCNHSPASENATGVQLSRPDIARRQVANWTGIHAERIEFIRSQPFEFSFCSPYHTLVAVERGSRFDGETFVEGAARSTLREFRKRLIFVPAGQRYCGWHKPNVLIHLTYLRINALGLPLSPELRFSEIEFAPRLFFQDPELLETALKIRGQIEKPISRAYVEALGIVLAYELDRMNGASRVQSTHSGGLAGWQQKRLQEYISEHLDSDISVMELARIAQLTPFHFTRAFKRTFGEPPHRYLVYRRIELAKELLGNPSRSMTEIAQAVGFADGNALTAAFRRTTGATPTTYRRSLA